MPARTHHELAIAGYNGIVEAVNSIDEVIAKNPKRDELIKKLIEVKSTANKSLVPILSLLKDDNPKSYPSMEKENTRLAKTISSLEKQRDELTLQVQKLSEYSDVVSKVKNIMEDWRKDFDSVDNAVKREVQEAVKVNINQNLKAIMEEAVQKVVGTEKMKKTFAEAVKNSEKVIGQETKRAFEEKLSSALKQSQSEIVAQTSARQEADLADKEKRTRNVVITTVPESTLKDVKERVTADSIIATKILGIADDVIEKCFRAGPPLGTGSNKDRTSPRPLICVLTKPELAKSKHKYGNGSKVIIDGVQYWINADLSRAERRANFEARQKRRERIMKSNVNGNAENSDNVAID